MIKISDLSSGSNQRERGISRREFVRRSMLLGATAPVVSVLLAACGAGESTESTGADTVADSARTTPSTSSVVDAPASTETSGGATKETLTVGWLGDLLSLDPSKMRDTLDTELGYKLYSSLVRIKTGTVDELVGDLAETWEVSPDGLEYRFSLRPTAVWQRDYGPVTAADVQYSFMRHKDESVGSLYATEAANIKDVQFEGDHTAIIIMEQPYPGFLAEFAAYRPGFIVNKKAIEDAGERYNERPVGSGPFLLEVWLPNEKVEIVRHDGFYGDPGPFKRVTYVIIPEEATIEIALEKGEIDIAYFFNPETQARVTTNPNLKSESITGPRTYYLQLNLERQPLDDVRVRQALWWAIDKDALVEGVLLGQGEATDTLLNPHVFGRLAERPYTYDPDRARQLLTEAGYPDGFKTSLLIYDTELVPELGTAIQAMWREIGVVAELIQREWAQHVEVRRSGNFDIALQPQLRLGPDQYITPLMHSSSIPYPNASRYNSPEADELIDKARITVDESERERLYHEIQRIVYRDVPVIPLVHPVFVLAFQPVIQGAVPGLITLNVTEMSVTG